MREPLKKLDIDLSTVETPEERWDRQRDEQAEREFTEGAIPWSEGWDE